MTMISLIMPTYNRAEIVRRSITQLFETQKDFASWELVVVNDGSTDHTATVLQTLQQNFPFQVIAQSNRGPGAARNAGAQRAQGELWVFIGDDIFVAPHFLAAHWAAYQQCDDPLRYGAIGQLDWHAEIAVTPFRRWIHGYGMQFGYDCLPPTDPLPFQFFQTANGALSRDLWGRGGPFLEDLGHYGWEDVELAYRYETAHGLRLQRVLTAKAYHHHALGIRDFCQRRYLTGRAARRLLKHHPQLASFLKAPFYQKYRRLLQGVRYVTPLSRTLATALDYVDHRLHYAPIFLIRCLLWSDYFMGFAEE